MTSGRIKKNVRIKSITFSSVARQRVLQITEKPNKDHSNLLACNQLIIILNSNIIIHSGVMNDMCVVSAQLLILSFFLSYSTFLHELKRLSHPLPHDSVTQ